MKNKGFTLIELMIVVAIIGILALIAIPNFMQLRQRAYNASAQTAGRSGKLAEELYYQDSFSVLTGGGYTNALANLLTYDRNLTDDASVTFSFTAISTSGYTFITSHARGSSSYLNTQ